MNSNGSLTILGSACIHILCAQISVCTTSNMLMTQRKFSWQCINGQSVYTIENAIVMSAYYARQVFCLFFVFFAHSLEKKNDDEPNERNVSRFRAFMYEMKVIYGIK